MELSDIFKMAKTASRQVAALADEKRNEIIKAVADAMADGEARLLEANTEDLMLADKDSPLYDRLRLTSARLRGIAAGMRNVAALPSPTGRRLEAATMANGLRLRKMSVPFGVVGVIYEARPNVSFDVFALCFKSGNACVLKGGKDADHSNRAIVGLIQEVLRRHGICASAVTLLPSTHEATAAMLRARGLIDVCIPRGGRRLIDFVRETASVPVIETGAGVVHTYVDSSANTAMATQIVNNAKTRRVSVCNALDCLIIHKDRLSDLPEITRPLAASNVRLRADSPSAAALAGHYPADLIMPIDKGTEDEVYETEYMDYEMGIKTVASAEEAMAHIARYGSGHSECIVTEDRNAARSFQRQVDAACVYWNAPTSFTDGAQFGLGAEIGISTQKIGPRGPMGLREMTTYKWTVDGEGQIREK